MHPKIMKNNAYVNCGDCDGTIERGEYCIQLGHYWHIHGSTDNRPLKLHIGCGFNYKKRIEGVLKEQ